MSNEYINKSSHSIISLGDEMKENELSELVYQHQDLIYSIIHKFRSKDYDDLFQAGCIGLINAYRNYDGRGDTKFSSYAYNYILGEVYKHIINNRNIHMSPMNIKLSRSLTHAIEYLTNHLGRNPSDDELCSFLEIDQYKLYEIRSMMTTDSLDYEYDGSNLYDFINVEKVSRDSIIDLKNALSSLNTSEKRIISARYFSHYTQSELAKRYHTNQVKISREEKRILSKLKARMQ